MPIYEYRCKKCGVVTEILSKSTESKEGIICSECGSADLEKMFSTSFVKAKGNSQPSGRTCCGRDERCDVPPCSDGSCLMGE